MKSCLFSSAWLLLVFGSALVCPGSQAREDPREESTGGGPGTPDDGVHEDEVSFEDVLGPELIENANKIELFEQDDFLIRQDFTAPSAPGGRVLARTLDTTPVLGAILDGGVATAIVELEPCGTVPPHIHPGGTENHFVIEGNVTVAFVTEVPFNKVLSGNVSRLESYQVPQGLVHWIENKSCDTKAVYTSSFPAPDPGASLIGPALGVAPVSVLAATFPSLSEAELLKLKASAFQAGVPAVNPLCQKACGLV